MKHLLLSLVAVLMVFASCKDNKPADGMTNTAEAEERLGDTTQTEQHAIDSIEPPVAADGLFDDFVYSFMRNKKFQLQRIKFPLTNIVDGKNHPISKDQWTFDRLYANEDVYTMLFDDERSVNSEKDSTVGHVTVEWVYLSKGRVKQYRFAKERGRWWLMSLDTHPIGRNVNSDFFNFYHHFSTDTAYQMAHIANPFSFKTYDSDTFQEIEGVLDVAQWPDFKPQMPTNTITNICYGQRYAANGYRVLVITSPSAGMSCTLSFKKKRGNWKLVRMETI